MSQEIVEDASEDLIKDVRKASTENLYAHPQSEEVAGDKLAQALIGFLKPCVEQIDDKVKNVRQSQVDLRSTIDSLAEDLKVISDSQRAPIDLEPYVKKLNNARRRVMLVNNILQNTQDRLVRLHKNVTSETTRRKPPLSQTVVSDQHAAPAVASKLTADTKTPCTAEAESDVQEREATRDKQ